VLLIAPLKNLTTVGFIIFFSAQRVLQNGNSFHIRADFPLANADYSTRAAAAEAVFIIQHFRQIRSPPSDQGVTFGASYHRNSHKKRAVGYARFPP
jgi:hypothetical protein